MPPPPSPLPLVCVEEGEGELKYFNVIPLEKYKIWQGMDLKATTTTTPRKPKSLRCFFFFDHNCNNYDFENWKSINTCFAKTGI